MIIISDTSPLRYLVVLGCADLLPQIFGRVLIPPAVLTELTDASSPEALRLWATPLPEWLEVRRPASLDATLDVDPGETEAISLAQELHANRLLIDDAKGRRAATERGIPIAGTLGILTLAADLGMIDLPAVLDRLVQTNFRVSPALIRKLRNQQRP